MIRMALLLLVVLVCLPVRAQEASYDPLPNVMRTAILWTRGEQMTDMERVRSLNINMLHSWPRDPDSTGFAPPAAYTEALLAGWKSQVAELHAMGVAVYATTSSGSFDPAVFERVGLKPEDYYARDTAGEANMSLGGAFGKQLLAACYNNPNWFSLQRDVALLLAAAGFDGMWYDLGGYADNNIRFCQCAYCTESWQAYLRELGLPEDTPQPQRETGLDLRERLNQHHLTWRLGLWEKNWKAVFRALKQQYPHFTFGHNLGAKANQAASLGMWLHAHTDLFDYVHWEEYGHSLAPYNQLPTYLLGLAAGQGKPVILLNFDKPRRNQVQHHVALAEAIATSSGHQHGVSPPDGAAITRKFNDFVAAHEEKYAGTRSYATVGVLYGWWNNMLHAGPARRNPSYYFAQLLLDLHVPFDFVLADRDMQQDTLKRYAALILPDQAVLTDVQIEALKTYLQEGGAVFATGELGTRDETGAKRPAGALERVTGRPSDVAGRFEVGKGRLYFTPELPELVYWEENSRDLQPEAELSPPQGPPTAVQEQLEWVFNGCVPLQTTAPATASIIVRQNEGGLLLHFVNYNVYPDAAAQTPAHDVAVSLRLPPEQSPASLHAYNPEHPAGAALEWHVEDGQLRFTLPELGYYALVHVAW